MQSPAPHKEITPWVDLIRVVAVFLVVIIHVSGQLTNVWDQIPTAQWLIADAYGSIARIGVPLFFMISGYLLLPRTESLRALFAKRIVKIVVPLVAWSAIYLAWFCGGHPGACTPSLVRDSLFVQGAYYHLWFLYSLLSIYLVLPLLRLMIRPETDRMILWYLIVLWLVFQPIWTLTRQFLGFYINITPSLATGFLPYFILGYLLGEIALSRKVLILSALLLAVGVLATIVGTYFMTRSAGQYSGFFYDFVSLNVLAASAGAFVLLRWAGESPALDSRRVHGVTRSLATASFGIYLIHIIIIEALGYGLHVNSFMGSASWTIPLVSLLVFGISFLLVRGMQRIPLLKQIVP